MSGESEMASQYQVLEELGSGSFGTVYKAIDRATGEVVAIKHIDLESSDDDIQEIQQEISVLSTCASPFVTQYKTSFLRGYKLWIVMEYLGGGSCLDLLKPGSFNEAHIAIVCQQLLLGLDYLHQEGKIHRDIKAANILLSQSGKVKLADFGVAAQLTNIKSQRNTFVGTPFWMAPEVIQQAGYDFKADIWSLGITAMELINGEPPNASTHPMKVLFLIPKAPAPRLEGNNYSKEFKDFIAACLVKDPDQRPSAKELLRHKFIRNAGKTEVLQELVQRRQDWDSGRGNCDNLKYYAETLNTVCHDEEKDGWVFDTVKAPTMTVAKHTQKRRKIESLPIPLESPTGTLEMLQQLDLQSSINYKPLPFTSTVRKISETRKVSPSQKLSITKRGTSGQKKPLGPNLNFGNSPSTVRQFRRVSDKSVDTKAMAPPKPAVDENNALAAAPAEAATKEALLGKRAYSKSVGITCQEVLDNTSDQERREAISRLAEAWSELEMKDPEGLYHILKLSMERIQSDPKLAFMLPPSAPSTPQKPKLVLAQNNPHLKSHRRRQSTQVHPDTSTLWSPPPAKLGLPGQHVPGMEHTKQLAGVLYERWTEGLRNRWPGI